MLHGLFIYLTASELGSTAQQNLPLIDQGGALPASRSLHAAAASSIELRLGLGLEGVEFGHSLSSPHKWTWELIGPFSG